MHAPGSSLPTSDLRDIPDIAADIFARLRARSPRVHCITNAVAQNLTANVLLATGAVPSMTVDPLEIAQFVERADSLLVNLGTLNRDRREAAEIAIDEMADGHRPWVLDPVFVDRSEPRSAFAKTLVARQPWAIRLNGAEFSTLADAAPEDAALKRYVLDHLGVIALTGATDVVTDGSRLAKIDNGHPLMGQVTAMGCAGAAVVTACLAVEADPWLATVAGLLAFSVAGECAAMRARGPGSFVAEIIDALARLDRETLCARAKVKR
jgi:hydroxyethylthiazole kinase